MMMPVLESFPLYTPENKVDIQDVDLTGIQSDLHALQKLYGLLKDDVGAWPNAISETVDDKARHMLKHLLDEETKRVFKVHSEIVGRYEGESFPSPQQLHENVNLKFPVEADLPKVVKSFREDPKGLNFSPLKAGQACSNPANQSAMVKPSGMNFTANGFPNRKKRCRICKRTVKQVKSSSMFSDQETQDLKGVDPPRRQRNIQDNPLFPWDDALSLNKQSTETAGNMEEKPQIGDGSTSYNLSCARSTAFSVNRHISSKLESVTVPRCRAEKTKNTKETDQLSKEASETIKEIESRILALQIDSEDTGPPRKRAAQLNLTNISTTRVPVTDNDCTVNQTKGEEARGIDFSDTEEYFAGRSNLLQTVNQSDHEFRDTNSTIKVPTRSMTPQREMKLPNLMVNQLPKQLLETRNMMNQVESHGVGSNADLTSGCDRLTSGEKPIVNQSSDNHKLIRVPSQNIKDTSIKFESLLTIPSDQIPCQMSKVKGFGFPEDPNKTSNWASDSPPKFLRQMKKEHLDENQMDLNERIREFIVQNPAHKVYPARVVRGKKRLPGKWPRRRGVLDQKPIQPSSTLYHSPLDQHQVQALKNNGPRRPVRKVLMDQEEAESITSDSESPSWSTQKISTSCSESVDYSESSVMESDASPSCSSESEAYSLPYRNQDCYMGATSSSENEGYSASCSGNEIYSYTSSDRTYQSTPVSSSESKRYSLHVRSRLHHDKGQTNSSEDSASRRKGRSGVSISNNGSTTKKQNGRLKKLKDKLAIIFHHHHHHHHHLHPGDESDHINQQANTTRGKALWKQSRKLAYPKREKERHGERAIEKLGKPIRQSKNQHKHFHDLVKGVLRHIKHSKAPKSSKKATKRLARPQHGNKEAFKKSHWWQVLQNQNRRAPKKAHSKLGFENKKLKHFS